MLHSGRWWPAPPGAPCGQLFTEAARLELDAPSGDPWTALEAFVASARTDPGVAGVGVLLTHEAAVAALDERERARSGHGKSSPAQLVPDLVAIAYAHSSHPEVETGSDELADIGPSPVKGTWKPSWTPAQHRGAVEVVRAAIEAGEVYQVNLVGHRRAALVSGAEAAHSAAWRLAGLDASFAGSIVGSGWSVHSASPELALDLREGVIATEPIKGTITGVGADRAALLRASLKDRAEHVMIVDLERNDLGRLAATGSVEVDELFDVRAWQGLSHAHSRVSARLRPGVGLAEVLRAVLPGGSVTGAPKVAALHALHALEPVGRGPAMGAMGWLGADGTLTLGLTIRTIACDHQGGWLDLWTGGGVTWGSTPEGEVAEAEAKAAAVIAALVSTPVSTPQRNS